MARALAFATVPYPLTYCKLQYSLCEALQYRPMSSKAVHACKEDTDGRRYPHQSNQPRG